MMSLGTGCVFLLCAAPVAAAPPDTGIDWGAEVEAAKHPRRAPPAPTSPTAPAAPPASPKAPAAPPAPASPVADTSTASAPAPRTRARAVSRRKAPAPAPTVVATSADDLVAATSDIAAKPSDIAAATSDIAAKPSDIAAKPSDIPATFVAPAPVTAPTPEVIAPATRALTPRERQQPARVRAQLYAGAALALGGVAGRSVMASGLHVHRISERELARGAGYPAELLAPLESQHDRGETKIAAGAIAGAVGLALGTALIVAGVRELRAGRREQARLRITPTLGGVLFTGRF